MVGVSRITRRKPVMGLRDPPYGETHTSRKGDPWRALWFQGKLQTPLGELFVHRVHMKSSLIVVLSVFVFVPLSAQAISGLYPPGSSTGNPIYVEIEEPYTSPLRFDTDKALQNSPWQQQQRWDAAINGHLPSNLQQPQQQIQYVPYPVYRPAPQAQGTTLTLDQRCKRTYGNLSIAYGNSCSCVAGYEWGADMKSCVPQKSKDQRCKERYGAYSAYTRDTNSAGDFDCGCVSGYGVAQGGSTCVPLDQMCRSDYGQNTRWDSGANKCACNAGYGFNGQSCTSVQSNQTASVTASGNLLKCSETGNKAPCKMDLSFVPIPSTTQESVAENGTAASTSPKIATGIFSVFGLLVFFGGLLRLLA